MLSTRPISDNGICGIRICVFINFGEEMYVFWFFGEIIEVCGNPVPIDFSRTRTGGRNLDVNCDVVRMGGIGT